MSYKFNPFTGTLDVDTDTTLTDSFIHKDGTTTTTASIPFAEGAEIAAGKHLDFGDDGKCYLYRFWGGVSPSFYFANTTGGGVSFFATDGSGGANPPASLFGVTGDLDCKVLCASGKKMLFLEQVLDEVPLVDEAHLLALDGTGALVAADSLASTPGDFTWTGTHDFTEATVLGVGVDEAANYTWSGTHAFQAATSIGVSGTNGDLTLYGAGATSFVWDGDAADGTAAARFTSRVNTDKLVQFRMDLTSKPGGGFVTPVYIDLDARWTGGPGIVIGQKFEVTDARTINAGGTDFLRAFSMDLTRAGYTNAANANTRMQGIYLNLSDSGAYSSSSIAYSHELTAYLADIALAPVCSASSARTYPVSLIKLGACSGVPSGAGAAQYTLDADWVSVAAGSLVLIPGFGWSNIDSACVDFGMTFSNFGGTLNQRGFDFRPTISHGGGTSYAFGYYYHPTISGTLTAEYAVRADRSRVALRSDGSDTASAYAGGNLTFGAAEDASIYFDGTDLCIASDFQGAGAGLNLVDQAYAAITTESLAGYITIKVGGTVRKLAVVA